MSTRRERSQLAKRVRIITAARQLFHTHGFDATTMEQIAAAADIAKGTVFLYAPTKADLLVLVYETDLLALVRRECAQVEPGGAIVPTLLAVFGPIFALYGQNKALARRFVSHQLFQPDNLQESAPALHALLAHLVVLIADWQAQGRVAAELVPEQAAQTTFMLYFGVLVAWLRGQVSDEARDAYLLAIFAMHWHGFILDA